MDITGIGAVSDLIGTVVNKIWPDKSEEEKQQLAAAVMVIQGEIDNTKDARDMQKVTRSNVPAVLSVLITVGFFGVLIGMLAGQLKVTDNQALLIMLGALGAAWGAVVNYWFGSSAESGRKSDLLANAPAIKN